MPDNASPIDNALSQIAREQKAFSDRKAREELPPDPDPELHALFVDFVSRLGPTTARPFVIQGPRRWVQKRVKAGWLGLKSYSYDYEVHDNKEQARGWYTGFGETFIAIYGDGDRYPPTDGVPGCRAR